MRALARWIIVQWGWRRWAIAFGAGAVSVLALAPFHFGPVLWLTLPVLVWLLDGTGSGQGSRFALAQRLAGAAATGWVFGFGYFLAGLYWIGYAFLVEADVFGWLLPFAVALLPAGLALFTAAGCALAMAVWSSGPGRIFALASGLTLSEWLRGHLFTGFPWNPVGQGLAFIEPAMQGAALVGVWGLTFLAVLIFCAPALLADDGGRAERILAPLAGLLALAALIGGGMWRMPPGPAEEIAHARLRIVQPNIPQALKWRSDNRSRIFADYLQLSDAATSPETSGIADVTHLIWPESALPFVLAESGDALATIAAVLPDDTVLVTGAIRRGGPGGTQAFNSIHVVDGKGAITATYDKVHLVPFGEYLPFQHLLERLGLQQLTQMQGGFEAGERREALDLPGLPPAAPLICYEIIFPDEVIDRDRRPGWMLNLTNDGWFGDSSGPRQHLHQARLRAIEEGLPVVRAANTGISAVIDPYGRIVQSLPLNRAGVIDSGLPAALPPTLYARYGRAMVAALLVFGFGAAFLGLAADRRRGRASLRRRR
ncbi:MAG: apolipoprotein N-acyltransferase [Rhodobiaceae bacterium]|nr:apolipoprotein N-acyltransferase [Rhodobiaceae bacterium]